MLSYARLKTFNHFVPRKPIKPKLNIISEDKDKVIEDRIKNTHTRITCEIGNVYEEGTRISCLVNLFRS